MGKLMNKPKNDEYSDPNSGISDKEFKQDSELFYKIEKYLQKQVGKGLTVEEEDILKELNYQYFVKNHNIRRYWRTL